VPPLTRIGLEGDVKEALSRVPPRAGVGQVLGPEGRNLVIGRAANLRKWASHHLGFPGPVAKGRRPPTDLRPIATAVAFAEASSSFHQRLLFERLMEAHVPRERRRDLKPPAFLHLDPRERFPRVTVRGPKGELAGTFGPFRDKKGAERAREALQKVFALRPCDYAFEPDPNLALGLACLFAQVRSCAAPCLARVSEGAYRERAAQAEAVLAGRALRPDELARVLPAHVAETGSRGLVVASNRERVELYPVAGGRVCEEQRRDARASEGETLDAALPAALADLRWDVPPSKAGDHPLPAGEDDWPWLLSWLTGPRRGGAYLVLAPAEPAPALAARVREVLT
jgi:hypothetical protein